MAAYLRPALPAIKRKSHALINSINQIRVSGRRRHAEKRTAVVPRSMEVETLMNCEAGARTSIRLSKAPSPLGKRPKNFDRLPLKVGSRRKRFLRRQKQLSLKTSQFSSSILTHKVSVLPYTSLARQRWRATIHPCRVWCLLTQQYAQQKRLRVPWHPVRLSAIVSPASRVLHAPEGHQIDVREERTR